MPSIGHRRPLIKSRCPSCGDTTFVVVVDKGRKRLVRGLIGNNRLACVACKITWRRWKPDYCEEMRTKSRSR